MQLFIDNTLALNYNAQILNHFITHKGERMTVQLMMLVALTVEAILILYLFQRMEKLQERLTKLEELVKVMVPPILMHSKFFNNIITESTQHKEDATIN